MEDLVRKHATPSELEMLENDLIPDDQKSVIEDTVIARGEMIESGEKLSQEERVLQRCEANLFLLEQMIDTNSFTKNDLKRILKATVYHGVHKNEPEFQNNTERNAYDLVKQVYKDKIYLAIIAMGGKFESKPSEGEE